jgi:polysaccharide biosynthesis transport protein
MGLLEVLDGEVRLQDALVRDPRSGLAALPLVVPRGGIAERPSRAQYALLVDAAKPHFDYVVFDGGALLEDFGARTVGEVVDQVVMVVRSGKTRRAAVVEALELLRAPKSKLAGAVLNMADRKASTQYDLG